MIEFTLIKLLIFKFLQILSFKTNNKLMMVRKIMMPNKESLKRATRIVQFNRRMGGKQKMGMK